MNDAVPERPVARPRPPVRRVSRQRYMVRRVGALVVLSVLVFGTVRLAAAIGGSDGATADAGSSTTLPGASITTPGTPTSVDPAAVGTSDGVAGVTSGTTVPTTVAPTTPATPANTGPPSAANPATLLIAGDSDAGTFGPYLETLLSDTGMVTTELDYKVSSGLARPDFFNWPQHFQESIPVVAPSIVVVTFGGNDPQGLATIDGNFIVDMPTGEVGGDVEWRAEYGKRVGEVMDYLSADGRKLVWVGIPNDDNPDVTARLTVQNEVVQAEAAKRSGVVFIDTWKRFSGRNGNWAEFVIDPRDGVGKDVRADDGFHLNETGAQILALDIAEVVKGILRERGATI